MNDYVRHKIVCPECGNGVFGGLPSGVMTGPEAIGHPWPKHYRRNLALGCPHWGIEHPIKPEHVQDMP